MRNQEDRDEVTIRIATNVLGAALAVVVLLLAADWLL